jgi:glycerol-3-phosphate acyltransferase PlsY
MLAIISWTVAAYLLGAIPFSLILTKIVTGKDVRDFGDGNPGATNAWRAGGWRVGLTAIFLDALKGAAPAGLAVAAYGLDSWAMLPIAAAPIIGHAYSPFLGFKGGKSVSVSYGVWLGLLFWKGPLALAIGQGMFFIFLASDAWITVLGAAVMLIFYLTFDLGTPVAVLAALNIAVFVQRYWDILKRGLKLRHNRPFEWVDTGHWRDNRP